MDFVYGIVPGMISTTIAYILLFKVWKNPLRLIGNTERKKILYFVIIWILYYIVLVLLDRLNINYKEVYDSLLLGIIVMFNGRLFCTYIEGEDKYKSKKN